MNEERWELTDKQFAKLAPHLPPQKPRTGRPSNDHRTVLEGILWVLRIGAPWRDLPARYGSPGTASSRFYRWRQDGTWDRILAELQRQADAAGDLDWTLHFVDSTTIRAHQHAAGAKGGTQQPRPWGAAGAGSRPRSTSGPRAWASPWSSR